MLITILISALLGTIIAVLENFHRIKKNKELKKFQQGLHVEYDDMISDIDEIEKKHSKLQDKLDIVLKELNQIDQIESSKNKNIAMSGILNIEIPNEPKWHKFSQISWHQRLVDLSIEIYPKVSIDRYYLNKIILGYIESSISQSKSIPGQNYTHHSYQIPVGSKRNTIVY